MPSRRTKIICYSLLGILVPVFIFAAYLRMTLVYVVNASHSLPDPGYAMVTWPRFRTVGTFVAFHVPLEIDRGFPFIKRIAGIAGDVITHFDGATCINGTCLPLTGEAPYFIIPTAAQVIPEGQIFVVGDTPTSFDSRYAALGLIHEDQIIAAGFALSFAPEWEGRH